MNLTEGQLLFRLQDFHGAEQEALGIGDYEFFQESADIANALRELLQARRTIEELTAVVGQRNGECVRLHSLLDAAEKRIAELEARVIVLPQRLSPEGYHIDEAYMVDDTEGEYLDRDAVIDAIRAAGIGVKQQEDSVDSDVSSRNQPGMVVAVHIGAGDFVKVKGQVFEVEETDFDDHDVTLWFVGGNALKCAAGCPVEVVSAPVAAGIKVNGE